MNNNKYGKYAVVTTHPDDSTHKAVWTSHGQVITPIYHPAPTLADRIGPWLFAIVLVIACVVMPAL